MCNIFDLFDHKTRQIHFHLEIIFALEQASMLRHAIDFEKKILRCFPSTLGIFLLT